MPQYTCWIQQRIGVLIEDDDVFEWKSGYMTANGELTDDEELAIKEDIAFWGTLLPTLTYGDTVLTEVELRHTT